MIRAKGSYVTTKGSYGCHTIRAMDDKPDKQEALEFLHRIADQVLPLCVKHHWIVGSLEEFYPKSSGLLGLNMNRGQKIFVRLRPQSNEKRMYDFEFAMDTMLHELIHNNHSNHSSDFYRALDALQDECRDLIRQGISGKTMAFSGPGQSLGGQGGVADGRTAAAQAAERRRINAERAGRSGTRLGGGGCCGQKPPMTKEERRALQLKAVERRMKDRTACVATQDGERLRSDDDEGGAAEVHAAPGDWKCGQCTLDNSPDSTVCEVCDAPRPVQPMEKADGDPVRGANPNPMANPNPRVKSMAGIGDSEAKELEWPCEQCTLLNPLRRITCKICGTARPSNIPAPPAHTHAQPSKTHPHQPLKPLVTKKVPPPSKPAPGTSKDTSKSTGGGSSRPRGINIGIPPKDGWACAACTFVSCELSPECGSCGLRKGGTREEQIIADKYAQAKEKVTHAIVREQEKARKRKERDASSDPDSEKAEDRHKPQTLEDDDVIIISP